MRRSLAVLLLLFALPAAAQMMHPGRTPGMRGSADDMMTSGNDLAVGPDGTIYVVRRSTFSGVDNKYELAAVAPGGALLWHALVPNAQHFSVVVGKDTVYVVSFAKNAADRSEIDFYLALTGTPLGAVFIDGIVSDVTPYDGGIYIVSRSAPGSADRKLLSVSNDGKLNWTLPLD